MSLFQAGSRTPGSTFPLAHRAPQFAAWWFLFQRKTAAFPAHLGPFPGDPGTGRDLCVMLTAPQEPLGGENCGISGGNPGNRHENFE